MFANATMIPNRSISGSFSNCGAPPESVMTSAIETLLMTAAMSVAPNAANHSTGPGVTVMSAKVWTISSETRRDAQEVRQVERRLDEPLPRLDEQGRTAPEEHRDQVLGRRQREEADDCRELTQREGVRLAPEVDLDDLELGERECGGEQRPPDDGVRRPRQVLQQGDVDDRRDPGQECRLEPDPSGRPDGLERSNPPVRSLGLRVGARGAFRRCSVVRDEPDSRQQGATLSCSRTDPNVRPFWRVRTPAQKYWPRSGDVVSAAGAVGPRPASMNCRISAVRFHRSRDDGHRQARGHAGRAEGSCGLRR